MSRLINKFLYYWLGTHLTDHTSGFRLYSRKAAEFLVKAKLQSKGFITLSKLLISYFWLDLRLLKFRLPGILEFTGNQTSTRES